MGVAKGNAQPRPLRRAQRYLVAAVLIVLAAPAVTDARVHLTRLEHVAARKAPPAPKLPPAVKSPAPAPVVKSAPVVAAQVIEIGDVPGCREGGDPGPTLRQYPQATVLRVIVNPTTFSRGAVRCTRTAEAEGYKVHIVIEWWNWMPTPAIVYFYQRVLAQTPWAWAVSVGNEQEIGIGGAPLSPRQYASVWRAVEPVVAAEAPQAIRVAGEVAPWSTVFFEDIAYDKLPGVEALSAHVYTRWSPVPPSNFLVVAARHQLPCWFDEGLQVPGAWQYDWTRPAAELTGATVLGAWLS